MSTLNTVNPALLIFLLIKKSWKNAACVNILSKTPTKHVKFNNTLIEN